MPKWDMTEAIKGAFDKTKIEIPFPQRVVTTISPGLASKAS
jgi:small-conductance mechanosensitive channel